MIIKCPSCQTKFSLRDEIIQAVKDPRFRCSRCSHTFDYENEFVSQEKLPGEQEPYEQKTADWPKAPVIPFPEIKKSFSETETTSEQVKKVSQQEFEFPEPKTHPPLTEGFFAEEVSGKSFGAPLGVALSLPLILTVLFYWTGQALAKAPESLQGLQTFSATSQPVLPPEGIELQGLRGALVTLENGEQVIEISGFIQNNTNQTFEDIQVEGELFDVNNQQVMQQVSPANNRLAQASKINALTIDAIQSAQAESPRQVKTLEPLKNTPFRIVFADSLLEAKWFSARVYSVKFSN